MAYAKNPNRITQRCLGKWKADNESFLKIIAQAAIPPTNKAHQPRANSESITKPIPKNSAPKRMLLLLISTFSSVFILIISPLIYWYSYLSLLKTSFKLE
ncbi:hypothetical protein RV00_GL000935 [Enterococcus devriesei]|uniref:Uncharacterized protein n=1 Tax=Enterococcus devriesei TaxID=319970 RepID=A0A1L8SQ83_9ENTE|nr:hypothetical protein RV00_GL000935 [Enterococcus devriesei]